ARYLPDGLIEYLGRIDHQVKIRGFRIELGEIESQLSQRPDVREVVVLAYESLNGEKSLVAYITSENNIALNVDVLRDDLKSVLPEFMIPAYFILLDAFPLTPNGKIDRKGLPAPDLSNNSAEYLAPETS
ncbi:AMP-binding enzyme, partial [Acinetobacter pittii]|uniref:AMP-binding enzyme n=1 Tax=Acinetobacter pittii TaxID=48296 RepID=UPI00301DDA7E